MRYPIFVILLSFIFFASCDEESFNVILGELPAPTDVQANIQLEVTDSLRVVVSPTATGATAFEILFGVPGETPLLVGLQQAIPFTYPDIEQSYTVTIRAISPNDLVTEEQFPVVPPLDPCQVIVDPDIAFESGESFFSFNGATVQIITNPELLGANPEATNVLEVINSGADFEGFGTGLSAPADFSDDDKTIRMLAWSNFAVPVRLIFQDGVDGARGVEVNLMHEGTGWEELRFDFNEATATFVSGADDNGVPLAPTGQYNQFVMFFSPGESTGGTFYLDNIGTCP